jgi:hypothetical protein
METINASVILYGVGARAGLTRTEISGDIFKDLRDALSRRLDEAWKVAKWPELTRWEERWFLDAYQISKTYQTGKEVFNLDDGLYYRAITTVPIVTIPPNPTYWIEVVASGVPMDAYIPYVQFTQTDIGAVFAVTEDNPKTNFQTNALDFWKSENGIQVPHGQDGSVARVWLEYRIRAPRLYGEVFSASATYAATTLPDQMYYAATSGGVGDFYNCVTGTTPGDTPVSAPTKWAVVQIPRFMERFLIAAVYADYLEGDGQTEKAAAVSNQAREFLAEERFVIEAQEGQSERMEVKTR